MSKGKDDAIDRLIAALESYDKTGEWWGDDSEGDKGADLTLSIEYNERLEKHAHELADAARTVLEYLEWEE